jgi:hypothetical protein
LGLTINGADEAFPFFRLASAKQPLRVDLGGQHVTVIFDAHSKTAGALVGTKHVPGYTGYWFAWAALHSKTTIWEGLGSEINRPPPRDNRGVRQSGVYGFSGTASSFGENRLDVVGECIWIYDASNQEKIASGKCSGNKPGEFRVPLAAGHYVARGPGGNKAVEIKNGKWTRVDSVFETPLGRSR